MDLAGQDAMAPVTVFSGGRTGGIGRPGKAGARVHLADPVALDALQRQAQQNEIDVRIDGGASLKLMLQQEGAQQVGIAAIGVERKDAGERRLVAQALAEGDLALPIVQIVVPEIGQDAGQRRVEIDLSGVGQRKDAFRGEQHLGQRGKVEPGVFGHRACVRHGLGVAHGPSGAVAVGVDKAKHPAGNAAVPDGGFERSEGAVEPGFGLGHCVSSRR